MQQVPVVAELLEMNFGPGLDQPQLGSAHTAADAFDRVDRENRCPAAPRVRSARGERRGSARHAGVCTEREVAHNRPPFTAGCM